MTFAEGQEFASQFSMPFFETSAKETQNVDMAFNTMTREIKEKIAAKPGGGGRATNPHAQAFGHGKALSNVQTPGAEPTAAQI